MLTARLMSERSIQAIFIACACFCMDAFADFPAVIERIKPSIVAVGTFRQTNSPPFAFRGTGFVVSDGNTVATNAHVVAELVDTPGGTTFAIQTRSGAQFSVRRARLISVAAEYDLALLRFDDAALPAVSIRDSNLVREGQSIGFTGFPIGGVLGFSPVSHRGIVSAITPVALPGGNAQQLNEKLVKRLRAGPFNIFQLDATAYPGNSGSPVFEADTGEVVGIINMVLVRGTRESALNQPTGIAYAIPARFLQELISSSK